jgi:hypothetical protein
VSASEAGPRGGRRPARARQVRLVTRLVMAQAAAAAAVGLLFSRRHLPSILITLALVAVCCLLALMVRAGTRGAWLTALTVESVFFLYGLSRFVYARYVGGTLFAVIVVGTLSHPGVARAYGALPGRLAGPEHGEIGLGEAPGEPFGGHAVG